MFEHLPCSMLGKKIIYICAFTKLQANSFMTGSAGDRNQSIIAFFPKALTL
jgi:hypothetical protein